MTNKENTAIYVADELDHTQAMALSLEGFKASKWSATSGTTSKKATMLATLTFLQTGNSSATCGLAATGGSVASSA